jgi:hypothetical protein
VENARNLTTKEDIPLTIKHYLKHMGRLTDQFFDTPDRYREKTRQRIYLKDIDCPPVWQDKLKEHIPSSLFYLNECTGEIGGPGALDEHGSRKGRGIARAGDLMSSLPPEMRADNLMCYIGHEGTYTPSHREMCASLGQNIMVNASGNISADGKPEHPGSSIWFMTETTDRQVVAEYWLSILGHDIEVENHFAQLIAWKKAPFKTYVVEQRPGDFILIPPLAPHQVWNRGTRTMKVAWNRTTVETLEMAMAEALPNSRIVCRDEQYKNKAIVYYTLQKYSTLIKSAKAQIELGGEQAEVIRQSLKVRQVQRDFKRLFDLYKNVLLSETFAPNSREQPEFLPYDSNVTCAYCRCNIFNRFLTCKSCKHAFSQEIEDPYDVCMDCYCMGRSCACQSGYTWCEQWKWKDLIHKYEEWRAQFIDIDGHMTEKTPLPLQEERRYMGKKTLAQVCQEQLKIRPFVDPAAPKVIEDEEDEETHVNDDGTVKKMVTKKSKQWLKDHKSCHFCLKRHPKWKMAFCTNCDLSYCYGTLFRAHDLMPLTVMEIPTWKCPHCRRTCNTGACRRDPRQHPYEPKGTLLGHDTKKVADPRSVECLVDFSVSNLNWLREDEIGGNGPMQRRRTDAERAKQVDPTLDARYMDEDPDYADGSGITYSPFADTNTGFNDIDGTNSSGFVAPSAVMQRPDTIVDDDGFSSTYPDPDLNSYIPRLGKRSRDNDGDDENSSGIKKKQRRIEDHEAQPATSKNASGKQYQKEVQKKLFDEAKRDNRFIIVAARIKNKSKIVKFSISCRLLEEIQQRPEPEGPPIEHPDQEEEPSEVPVGLSILQSDIIPKAKVHKPGEKPKPSTSFRVRVDEDETYSTRKRSADNGAPAKPGRSARHSQRYEEFTLDSDEDIGEDEMAENWATSGPGRPKARSSVWLARKNEGEEDIPAELPHDFKDGMVNRREADREREIKRQEQRKTAPPKPKARIRPPGRPPKTSTGDMSDHSPLRDTVQEEFDNSTEALLLAQSATAVLEASRRLEEEKARIKAAEKEVEENRQAKMDLWGSDDDDVNNIFNEFAANDEPLHEERDHTSHQAKVSFAHTSPPTTNNSIFSRPGMAGKKIKIVSSKKNGGSGPSTSTSKTIQASVGSFTPVNRIIDLSSSDSDSSENKIPTKAPIVNKGRGRLVGRVVVPTRGTGKRGRGRPRKTV